MREAKEGLTPSLGLGWCLEQGGWLLGRGGGWGLDLRETAALRHLSLSIIHVFHQLTPSYEMPPIGTSTLTPHPSLPASVALGDWAALEGPLACALQLPGRWGEMGGKRRRKGLEPELPGLLCEGLQAGTVPPPEATAFSDSHSLRFREPAPWSCLLRPRDAPLLASPFTPSSGVSLSSFHHRSPLE